LIYFENKKIIFYLYCILLFVGSFFNGSNSNLSIQLNFIFFACFFLFLLSVKNYKAFFVHFFRKNKIIISLYALLLAFILLQMLPIPLSILKYASPAHYAIIQELDIPFSYYSISLDSQATYFQFLNFVNFFLIILCAKCICINSSDKNKFYFIASLVGFVHAFVAIYLYLQGNPPFFLKEIVHYKNSATGFFVNRNNFAIYLCLVATTSVYCLFKKKEFQLDNLKKKKEIIDTSVYIRIFLLFISIAIITSLSKTANFCYAFIVIFFLLYSFKKNKKIINFFSIFVLTLVVVDVFIFGFYFGSDQLIDRFALLKDDLVRTNININNAKSSMGRFDVIEFSIEQIKNFIFFGYGVGSYETVFKLYYSNPGSSFANHAHSDIVEFVGELGLVGSMIVLSCIFLILKKIYFQKKLYSSLEWLYVFSLMFVILIVGIFDFSYHIPSVQYLTLALLSVVFNKQV
jgi:O-antigen ligase